MAEGTVTLPPTAETPPTKAGNGGSADVPGGPSTRPEGTPPTGDAAAPPPYAKHGFNSWEEWESNWERNRERLSGFEAETKRLQQASQAAQDRVKQLESWQQEIQPLLINLAGGQGQGTPAKTMSLQEAVDAYLSGNQESLQAYEKQIRGQGYVTPEQMNQHIGNVFSQLGKLYQAAEFTKTDFPEIADTKSPFYREVFTRLRAASVHPTYRTLYPEDPVMQADWPDPDGLGSIKADHRIVRDIAWRVKVDMAREDGRKAEFARAQRPVTPTANGSPPTRDSQFGPLLTPDERRFIREHLNELPKEWGRTEEAVAKYRWEKLMSNGEKDRRIALQRAGQWS